MYTSINMAVGLKGDLSESGTGDHGGDGGSCSNRGMTGKMTRLT